MPHEQIATLKKNTTLKNQFHSQEFYILGIRPFSHGNTCPIFEWKSEENTDSTRVGKSRFTVVVQINMINNNTRINCVSYTHNCKPTISIFVYWAPASELFFEIGYLLGIVIRETRYIVKLGKENFAF